MPCIRVNEEVLHLCNSCWPPTKQDLPLLAELACCSVKKLVDMLVQEEDGGFHSSYANSDEVCILCETPLTEDDDNGEDINSEDYIE